MCQCTPEIKTPFCGKPGCTAPQPSVDYLLAEIDGRRKVLRLKFDAEMAALEDRERDLLGLVPQTR